MFNKSININKINEKYGALIENLDFMMIFGACDKFLPFSKKEIEAALITQALYLKDRDDKRMLDMLIVCYQNLSLFLPYEKYNIVKKVYSFDGGLQNLKDENYRSKFLKILNETIAEIKERTNELYKILQLEPPRGVVLEATQHNLIKDSVEK